MYLRDCHDWKYSKYGDGEMLFGDLAHFMLLERRDNMLCKTFHTDFKEGNKTTKDAEYIIITLLDFLDHSNVIDDILYCQYNTNGWWSFQFIRLGLKVVRNAEIVIPTKESFPLIIRSKNYNFYIAGGIEEKITNGCE